MIPGQQPCCISLTFLQCVFFQMTPQSACIRGCIITLVAFEAWSARGDRIGGTVCDWRYQANNPHWPLTLTGPPGPGPRPRYTLQINTNVVRCTHPCLGYIVVPITLKRDWSKMLIWVGVLADIGSLITLTCAKLQSRSQFWATYTRTHSRVSE